MKDHVSKLEFDGISTAEFDDSGNPIAVRGVTIGSHGEYSRVCCMTGKTLKEAEIRAFRKTADMLRNMAAKADKIAQEIEQLPS